MDEHFNKIYWLLRKERIEEIQNLTENDVNVLDDNGRTLLMYFADRRNINITKILIKKGIDVNAQDNDGKTALMSINVMTDELLNIFLDNEIDFNIRDYEGKTALMHMIIRQNDAMAKTLINCGVDLNAKDNTGNSALMYAKMYENKPRGCIIYGFYDLVKLLHENGATV